MQDITVDLTKEFATPKYGLGDIHVDKYGNRYQFLQANGAKTAKKAYIRTGNTGTDSTSFQINNALTLGSYPADKGAVAFCVPQIAMTDNYYAWVFVGPGDFYCEPAEAVTAASLIYGSGDAGKISDYATACLLKGVTCGANITSGSPGLFRAATELFAEDL